MTPLRGLCLVQALFASRSPCDEGSNFYSSSVQEGPCCRNSNAAQPTAGYVAFWQLQVAVHSISEGDDGVVASKNQMTGCLGSRRSVAVISWSAQQPRAMQATHPAEKFLIVSGQGCSQGPSCWLSIVLLVSVIANWPLLLLTLILSLFLVLPRIHACT